MALRLLSIVSFDFDRRIEEPEYLEDTVGAFSSLVCVMMHDADSRITPSLTLKYKELPHNTRWLEYPDVKPFPIVYGVLPTLPHGGPRYTPPMIYDSNPVIREDSEASQKTFMGLVSDLVYGPVVTLKGRRLVLAQSDTYWRCSGEYLLGITRTDGS